MDDCPGYKLNQGIRCPIENYQCTNRGPLGPNQYGGHGWCYYEYDDGKTYWDWCGDGCKKRVLLYLLANYHELNISDH